MQDSLDKKEKLDSLEKVMSCYEKQLLRYAARITGNPDAAQDIVQETFIKLVSKWKAPFEPGPLLSTWLYRVAHNCAVDYIRRESRAKTIIERHSEELQEAGYTDIKAGDTFEGKAAKVMKALASLADREKQLVVLKVMEEKSYREISEITGLSISNVGYILHHAMKKLAAMIDKTGAEDEQPKA